MSVKIRNLFFSKKIVRKGGEGTPLTDKIREVVFDVAPKVGLKNKKALIDK